MSGDQDKPLIRQYMRRQAVAFELGITRHTLARLLLKDGTFPKFFAITPGIEVIARRDFDRWIRQKRLQSRVKDLAAPSIVQADPR